MKPTPINYARLLFPLGVSFLFIMIGIYLIHTETKMGQWIGYANVVFFSLLILFVIIKITTHHIKRKSA